ncbi:hypothetical protein ANN_19025 [Periplaneta americana]|uniref:Uncharacterized protein n=1 Tax=Periplaneta americana TaxID=6978 RepID=A0ABQ8SQC1_PERAM|nr:hypothetical protein ANN_19025 [Periplaneta americana]
MPSTWPGIEPATLGIEGQRYTKSPTRSTSENSKLLKSKYMHLTYLDVKAKVIALIELENATELRLEQRPGGGRSIKSECMYIDRNNPRDLTLNICGPETTQWSFVRVGVVRISGYGGGALLRIHGHMNEHQYTNKLENVMLSSPYAAQYFTIMTAKLKKYCTIKDELLSTKQRRPGDTVGIALTSMPEVAGSDPGKVDTI